MSIAKRGRKAKRAMTWQGKENGSIEIRCKREREKKRERETIQKKELIIAGPAGRRARVIVWTIAVEVTKMAVAVV